MKMPPAMIELFLRSFGAPPSVIELARLIQAEGFSAFQFQPASQDDPNWKSIGSDPSRSHAGIWLRAESPNSRVTAAIFFEGNHEKITDLLCSHGAAAGQPALIQDTASTGAIR